MFRFCSRGNNKGSSADMAKANEAIQPEKGRRETDMM